MDNARMENVCVIMDGLVNNVNIKPAPMSVQIKESVIKENVNVLTDM
jgi:hypothetical protein